MVGTIRLVVDGTGVVNMVQEGHPIISRVDLFNGTEGEITPATTIGQI